MKSIQPVVTCCLFLAAVLALARPGAAQSRPSSDRDIRREVRWSYDSGGRLLLTLTDGRQLTGVVTTMDDRSFDIDGEAVMFRSVVLIYRVVESAPLAKPRAHGNGFSDKWLFIGFAGYIGMYFFDWLLGSVVASLAMGAL
jgi:hypothetical protein